MKGTYLLVMELPNDISIMVGKQGLVHFQKGWYVYVGSALNGLDQRIQRHLREDKKIHWHIDYLLSYTDLVDIFYKEGTQREECRIARSFAKTFIGVPGFGCSDCTCKSHLFSGSLETLQQMSASFHMHPYLQDKKRLLA